MSGNEAGKTPVPFVREWGVSRAWLEKFLRPVFEESFLPRPRTTTRLGPESQVFKSSSNSTMTWRSLPFSQSSGVRGKR
jgi:hypothetical protein